MVLTDTGTDAGEDADVEPVAEGMDNQLLPSVAAWNAIAVRELT
jgi:hypothetical protein